MAENLTGEALLKRLSLLFGPSGCEGNVADYIEEEVRALATRISRDAMDNVIAVIEGEGAPDAKKKVMFSAHMDEVGFMIRAIDDDGYLKFGTVGGIDPRVLAGRRVIVGDEENKLPGVIGVKPIHCQSAEERKKVFPVKDLYIDIGATSKEEAEKYVKLGDYAVFDSDFIRFGSEGRMIKAKALDDRLGCAIMIELMRWASKAGPFPFDMYFAFTVREEIGRSGAKPSAYRIDPDYAIVLEGTAVGDIAGAPEHKRVAKQGDGGVLSLLDNGTIYDRDFVNFALDTAKKEGIKCQIKQYVSGGNDAAHIHKTRTGVRTLALSAPSRYIHTASNVIRYEDYVSMLELTRAMVENMRTNGAEIPCR